MFLSAMFAVTIIYGILAQITGLTRKDIASGLPTVLVCLHVFNSTVKLMTPFAALSIYSQLSAVVLSLI